MPLAELKWFAISMQRAFTVRMAKACERPLCNRMKHVAAATCCTPLQRCAVHFLFLFWFGSACQQPLSFAMGHSIYSSFCSFIYLSVAIDCAKAVRPLHSESISFSDVSVSRRAPSHRFFKSLAAFAATFFPLRLLHQQLSNASSGHSTVEARHERKEFVHSSRFC